MEQTMLILRSVFIFKIKVEIQRKCLSLVWVEHAGRRGIASNSRNQ